MSSGFVTISPQTTLSDGITKRNIISTDLHKVRIVGRNPASGKPYPGVPFSIDVEIQTNINQEGVLFRMPFWCPDATIVIRGAYGDSNKIWGHKFVTTRYTNSCTGSENIQFKQGFIPDDNHWVIIEVYKEYVPLQDLQNHRPVSQSQPMHFGLGIKEGRNAGLYDDEHQSAVESIASSSGAGFEKLEGILTKTLLVAGLGLGVYITAPLFPVLKKGIKRAAEGFK